MVSHPGAERDNALLKRRKRQCSPTLEQKETMFFPRGAGRDNALPQRSGT